MSSKVVLIHADTRDVHAQAVAKCLSELHVPSRILPRDRCFMDWSISCDDDEVIVQADGMETWTTDHIRSVLWRRDFIIEPAWVRWDEISPAVAKFLAEQRSIHVDCAFKRLTASLPFINNLDANRKSDSKVLQHHVARQCGLNVPKTYVGSDPIRAGK